MALSSLGKRNRALESEDSDLARKRPRRPTRGFVVVNDENQDPARATFEDVLAADVTKAGGHRGVSTRRTANGTQPTPLSTATAAAPLTPSTPRCRHGPSPGKAAVTAAAAATPVTPLTPSTPRHRVMSVGRLSCRATPRGMMASPRTPHAGTPGGGGSTVSTVYHTARQLFARSTGPNGLLVGRDGERARLQAFLRNSCGPFGDGAATTEDDNDDDDNDSNRGCLYVSGPPGTGKSALVEEVTDAFCAAARPAGAVRKAYVNCMSIRSVHDLYNTLLRLLRADGDDDEDDKDDDNAPLTEAAAVSALQALCVPKIKRTKTNKTTTARMAVRYLVVLDEIDHLLTLDVASLYRVIEWAMRPASRLALVGIANALDLTDRFLPRLKARNLRPALLPFLPYTAPQIKAIVTARLQSLVPASSSASSSPPSSPEKNDVLPLFHPAAIELCARKVASQTGDLRKVFEILRRALDLVEAEAREAYQRETAGGGGDASSTTFSSFTTTPTKKRPLGENVNLASSPSTPTSTKRVSSVSWAAWAAQHLTLTSAPRVSISHLTKVTAAAFGHGAPQRLRGLNLQQKAALCALVAFETRSRAEAAAAAAKATSTTTTPSKSARTTAAPTIKTLFATYCQMCKRDALLHPLSSTEFREVVGSLETLSLVAAVDGRRTGSFAGLPSTTGTPGSGRRGGGSGRTGMTGVLTGDERRVASCVGEVELQRALAGAAGADILRSILSGEALD
ncbi:cell division control protein [Niveomyces insectorum RCEF 264]|uniref:Cell division control protein n=1 Tax=Niveomyces insectorum RCEF 264 TaxID=1081102 RepID=A0A167U476_9HYPO|nr:cell division control protein [Niveomyces insectorum RCEF 264]